MSEEFTSWFSSFWASYPRDLSHDKKGSKQKAEQAALRIFRKLGISELGRIQRLTARLIEKDRAELSSGGRPDRWPHASTYLNSGYYDREISALNERPKVQQRACECGAVAVVGGRCARHYSDFLDAQGKTVVPYSLLKDQLKRIGLAKRKDETPLEYFQRCREAAKRIEVDKRVKEKPVRTYVPTEEDWNFYQRHGRFPREDERIHASSPDRAVVAAHEGS